MDVKTVLRGMTTTLAIGLVMGCLISAMALLTNLFLGLQCWSKVEGVHIGDWNYAFWAAECNVKADGEWYTWEQYERAFLGAKIKVEAK